MVGPATSSRRRRSGSTTPPTSASLDLRAKARRLHAQEKDRGSEGLGLVIVDYMQLMRADDPRANRVEQVGQISRGLKILARELDVPVIGISQLSRAPEQRARQAADPLRPARVRRDRAGRRRGRLPLPRRLLHATPRSPTAADLIIAKHRNGPIGTVRLVFLDRFPKFADRGARGAAGRAAGRRGAAAGGHRRRARALSSGDRRSPQRAVERQPCPLGVCDGSGWILGPEDVARPCECRARMVAKARLRGVASVIPPSYRGVSFDRPPVTEMNEIVVRRVRDYCVSIDENLDVGPRPLALRRHRHRQDDAGDAGLHGPRSRPAARSRSTRCRSCWRGSAGPTTPSPASTPTRTSSSA